MSAPAAIDQRLQRRVSRFLREIADNAIADVLVKRENAIDGAVDVAGRDFALVANIWSDVLENARDQTCLPAEAA